jgi:phosphatidylglycerol:prolipoprotein diacylglycerol transferase
MYLFGFILCWGLLVWRASTSPRGFTKDQISDLVFYIALGVILGGRLGYMLFYAWDQVLANPLNILMTWKGGMSFHGGVLGVVLAIWLWGRKYHKTVGEIGDFVVPVIPIGLGLGRIGNFINGELPGRVSDVSWAMVFPNAGDLARHPSQLYEAFLEGFILFIILWLYSRKPRPVWAVSGMFLAFYGLFRFSVEFFREPDIQKGYLMFDLTEGQWLSLPMIVLGIYAIVWAYTKACKRNKSLCSNI